MKVLIVRTFPDVLNLNTYNVQEIGLAKALTCKGITCGVILYGAKEKDREEEYRFTKDEKSYAFKIYWLKGWGFFKNGFMPSIRRIIKDYDVLQVHEYDQISSWMIYSRLTKPTVVYHGPYYHEYAKGYNFKCRIFDLLFLRWRTYEHVVALTKSELAADFLRKKGFSHVHAVGVGVDRDKFEAQQGEEIACRLEPDSQKFRILYVGKIEERRNVYFLMDTFEKLLQRAEDVQLVIVGDGDPDYRNAFLERIKPLIDAGKIIYYQKATQKELSLIYRRVNMFAFTSNYEIFGMVLLEAMYFGLPVISTMNGGSSVLISNGENGYIMQEFNAAEWMEKILYLKENKDACRAIGNKAHETIEQNFLWDRLADQFIGAYEEAVREFGRKFENHVKCHR